MFYYDSMCVKIRAPDTSPIKAKLLYASSKQALRQIFRGESFQKVYETIVDLTVDSMSCTEDVH